MSRTNHIDVSVIVPVFNEEETLAILLQNLEQAIPNNQSWEVIIVDDASTDHSWDIAHQHAHDLAVLLQHSQNRGKAAALRTGASHARGQVIVFQDADLEYDPQDLMAVTQPVLLGVASACFGNRMHAGRPRGMRYSNYVANRVLSSLTGLLYNTSVPDMETCYKAIDRELYRTLELRAERFGIEPEITSKILSRDFEIHWVPIDYEGRTVAEGKKIGLSDGVEAIVTLFRLRF